MHLEKRLILQTNKATVDTINYLFHYKSHFNHHIACANIKKLLKILKMYESSSVYNQVRSLSSSDK